MVSQLGKSGERIVGCIAMDVISFYGEEECMEWQRLHCTFTGSIVARLSERSKGAVKNRSISLGLSIDLTTRREIYHRIGSLVLNNPFICAEIR
jgi:hypothetical protein